jgi:hypothetical protein
VAYPPLEVAAAGRASELGERDRGAARRGRRIAIVALARRLAGIVYAMWRDGAPYDATKIRTPRPRVARTS